MKEFSQSQISARRYPTLDLASFDAFTLIVSSREAWAHRFKELHDTVVKKNEQRVKLQLQMWAVDTDFDFVDAKQLDLFEKGARLSEGGALLVRPDQHLVGCPGPARIWRHLFWGIWVCSEGNMYEVDGSTVQLRGRVREE